MQVAIIKYNAGNIRSVDYALRRLGVEPLITDDFDALRRADRVIFPGVGEASSTMVYLRGAGLDTLIPSLTQPVLGICLGMQLLCRHSEEGNAPALGIMDTDVKLFRPEASAADTQHGESRKVPHMGWNSITGLRGDLFKDVEEGAFVYFVHSYYAEPCAQTIATTDYIVPFSAALQRDNFFATQFHPEKSGTVGELILRNFLNL
jgi:glutamine amidotransferase